MSIKRNINLGAIERISKKIETTQKSNREILNNKLDEFINANTRFESLNSLFLEAGFVVENSADFAKIPQDQIDDFVNKNTNFQSLTLLQNEALKEYL